MLKTLKSYESTVDWQTLIEEATKSETHQDVSDWGGRVVGSVELDKAIKILKAVLDKVEHEQNRLLSELAMLQAEEYDEEFLRPTSYAVNQLVAYLQQVGQTIPAIPAKGHISTDGSGGLRLEWRVGDKEIRVVIPPDAAGRSYIYYENGSQYGTDQAVSPERITHYLIGFLSKYDGPNRI